jgi:hypothetical protein
LQVLQQQQQHKEEAAAAAAANRSISTKQHAHALLGTSCRPQSCVEQSVFVMDNEVLTHFAQLLAPAGSATSVPNV